MMRVLGEDITTDQSRLMAAAIAAGIFVLLCLWAALKGRRKISHDGALDFLVLHASQTGQAEEIALDTCKRLQAGGFAAGTLSLGDLTEGHLARAKRILCVASTTGAGEAPDEARAFERGLMGRSPDLGDKAYAVLALGDRNYDDFCAFGHRVDHWFRTCGAQALSPCLEVDDLEAQTLAAWNAALSTWGAATAAPIEATFSPWTLISRACLNPLSEAQKLYRIELEPAEGALPQWQAGDLAEILTPHGHRRDYSVASLPSEGGVQLLVRQVVRDDGQFGDGSGLLTAALTPGESVPLRVKAHKGFRAPEGEGPVLLIGAGSGLAGLRAHILEAAPRPRWLVFGERHPVKDAALTEALVAWQQSGVLSRLDLAFSRPDAGEGQYVQHLLVSEAEAVREYLKDDGAVIVCGALNMGQEVEVTLRQIMGAEWVEAAQAAHRYRRDLY
jgi:sulfite reductase (NADPH) flavoprotein alpha-component